MKKILFLLGIILAGVRSFAADYSQEERRAEQLYAAEKYADAAEVYDGLLKQGVESAALYYNLGNCYFKLGENTRAILNYERSLLLDPSDGKVRYNLKMAQNAVVDKIEVLPELFLVRWTKAVITSFSADQWGYWSVGLFILFLIMAALFFYSPSVGVKKTGFIVGIAALCLTVATVFFAVHQDRRISSREYAVIVTPSVTVKGAPDESGTSLFLVHEGLKVRIVGELGNWYNIRLADGNEGWVVKADLERI